jgi:hypothetical protein
MSMHTGQKHDYLRVDIELSKDGALEVSMFKYLQNVIDKFPQIITVLFNASRQIPVTNQTQERSLKAV